jgi:hypothetical protein
MTWRFDGVGDDVEVRWRAVDAAPEGSPRRDGLPAAQQLRLLLEEGPEAVLDVEVLGLQAAGQGPR